MSPAHLRPEIHVPWRVLAAFAALVYVLRSALRGWDFRADATDAIVFGLFTILLISRPLLRRSLNGDDEEVGRHSEDTGGTEVDGGRKRP